MSGQGLIVSLDIKGIDQNKQKTESAEKEKTGGRQFIKQTGMDKDQHCKKKWKIPKCIWMMHDRIRFIIVPLKTNQTGQQEKIIKYTFMVKLFDGSKYIETGTGLSNLIFSKELLHSNFFSWHS